MDLVDIAKAYGTVSKRVRVGVETPTRRTIYTVPHGAGKGAAAAAALTAGAGLAAHSRIAARRAAKEAAQRKSRRLKGAALLTSAGLLGYGAGKAESGQE